MKAEPLIAFSEVSHSFGEGSLRKQVLHQVTAQFQPGEIVILTGPSGSGKTTILTLAGGLRSIQDGSIRVCGVELCGADAATLVRVRRRIGFIFQAHNLLNSLTARENVMMSLALHESLPPEEARKRAGAALIAVGLADHLEKYPAQLSGGQKQRVAIARALVGQPRIILADEPTAALDKKSGREIVELLQNLAKGQGCAILLVTHDNRILDVADRILTLEDGRLTSFTKGLADNAGQMLNSLAAMNRRGDLIRHLAGLDGPSFVRFLEQSTAELQNLLRVIDLAQEQVSESMLEQVFVASTLKVGQLLDADRASIFLIDEKTGTLRSRIAQSDGDKPLEIVIPLSAGIAGHVARTGETVNLPDAYQHPLFNRAVDQKTGYRTMSLLCMPIYNQARQIMGVAQLLNKKNGRPFDSTDEERLRQFIPSIGVILEGATRMKSDRAKVPAST